MIYDEVVMKEHVCC